MQKGRQLLADKIALITGGGRGIGKSVALAFAREGADIVITARTDAQLNTVAEEIKSLGRTCVAIAADISVDKDVERVFKDAFDEFGRVDILVNNAGIAIDGAFVEISMEDWDRTININLRGAALCAKVALSDMLKRGEGVIINIASAAGLRGLPGNAAYSASKGGLIAMSHAVADELRGSGVRVNVICPGPIETEMLMQSKLRDFLLKNKESLLPPKDIAGAALYLASDLSGGLNSQVITVRNTNRW